MQNLAAISVANPAQGTRHMPGHMPRHIGIVACSSEGAALCYRTICVEGAKLLGRHGHPEVSMHPPSLAEYAKYFDRPHWQVVGEWMLCSAPKLPHRGANF